MRRAPLDGCITRWRERAAAAVLLALVAFTSIGCDRATRDRGQEPASEPGAKPGAPRAEPIVAAKPTTAVPRSEPGAGTGPVDGLVRIVVPERLVAIGDLHGDVAATRVALRLARAIDERDRWSGGRLVLVQTGDQLDRGDDEPDILALFTRLQGEARAVGGEVVVLNGNHELMNVGGDFRYVTPDGFADYAQYAMAAPPRAAPLAEGRARAYAPGGPVAKQLAQRPVVAIVGDSVFVHGGVRMKHLRYGLERIHRELRDWMLGARPAPPEIVLQPDSPLWTRMYSDGTPSEGACAELGQVLVQLGVKRMVVGHTVQPTGINGACGDEVMRIDVGMARFYGGQPQVLELTGGKVRVLKRASDEPQGAALQP